MDTINPWLDPIEVRRLAERLMRPVHEASVTITDAGFDEAFVGYAAPKPPSPSPAPPPATGMPAADSFPPPVPLEAAATPPASARGGFLERVQRFRDWMGHHFHARGLFILDREGSVIFDDQSEVRMQYLARSLALAARRPGASTGNVHVKVGPGSTLEVIPVETAYGMFVLGAVVPEPLSAPAVTAVMEAMVQVATAPATT
jgi:hypothetical protein